MRIKKLRWGIIAIAAAALLAPVTAQAGAEQDLHAFFWVDTWSTSSARAVVALDPNASVAEVTFSSPSCDVGPMHQIEPGLWVGEGPPGSSWDCWEATATVFLSGSIGGGAGSALPCPFVGLSKVTMSGGSYADSYDSSAGPYSLDSAGDEGHVCSNGSIRMNGNATVYGDALHGPGECVDARGNAAVEGYIEPLLEPLLADPVEFGVVALFNDNLEIPPSTKGRYPLNDRGDFSLSEQESVTLASGTYFFRELKLSGGSTLDIRGPTAIYVAGEFDASGGSIIGAREVPAELQLFVSGDRAKLPGHSDLYAMVYGPDTVIERMGSSDFYGALVGKELRLSGEGGLHHDVAYGAAGELTEFTMEWVFDE
jgi:hypothetical protein